MGLLPVVEVHALLDEETGRVELPVGEVVVAAQHDEELLHERGVVLREEVGQEEVGVVNALLLEEVPVHGDGGLDGLHPLLVDEGEVVARDVEAVGLRVAGEEVLFDELREVGVAEPE